MDLLSSWSSLSLVANTRSKDHTQPPLNTLKSRPLIDLAWVHGLQTPRGIGKSLQRILFTRALSCACKPSAYSESLPLWSGTRPQGDRNLSPTWHMLLSGTAFVRINCSFKNKKLKITKEKDIHNVSKNTTCQMYTNYAQWKRKTT